jgi:hypothetical protein
MRRFLFLALLPALFLFGDEQFSIGPVPEWVTSTPYALQAPVKPEQLHIQYLLSEKQSHWEKESTYCHKAVKILSQGGTEFLSELTFNFMPSFQTFVMHSLRLYRDGKWQDRLLSSRHQLLQREDGLEERLYDGSLTLVYFLTDLRVDDVVEFSYSVFGNDPILHPYHEDELYLEAGSPFEKLYYRIIPNEALPFYFKPFCTDLGPTVCGPKEWVWETVSTKPFEDEDNIPDEYNPFARVQLTQFGTWNEAVLHLLPHYEQPSALKENLEVLALISEWQSASSNKEELALMAIRFVQDQVRYFGFLEGVGSCRPAPAHETFERRSGDCKAKAVLLKTLLEMLSIDSYPLLVTSPANKMDQCLPNLSLFNHVVLQIQLEDKTFFVDPTIPLQGGQTLSDIYFPDYAWGLVIAKETKDLTPLPRYSLPKPTTISTSIQAISPDLANVETSFIFYGMRADDKRQRVQAKGQKKFLEYYTEDIPKKAKLLNPGQVADDRKNNVFSLNFSFQVPTTRKGGKKILHLNSDLLSLIERQDIKPDRKHPFALLCPFWTKEHIRIENSFNSWEYELCEIKDEQSPFACTYNFQKEGHVAEFDLEVHHFQESIAGEDLGKYRDLLHKLEAPEPLIISDSFESSEKTKQAPPR